MRGQRNGEEEDEGGEEGRTEQHAFADDVEFGEGSEKFPFR